jgi:MarR family transcriptional regulator, 2-MHQ and catechol-resistance regulon repressor
MVRTKPLARMLEDERITAFGILVEANARLFRIFGERMETDAGIPLVFFEVLLRIERSDDHQLSMGDLASQISITSGGVTRLIDRMEKANLVERRACPTDRRVNWLAATDLGRSTLESALRLHLEDLETHFISKFTERELANLVGLLDKLR